jgi:hypothetical protein
VTDPRVTLARDGAADAALQGLLRAERFVPTVEWRCAVPATAIRRAPADGAEQLDQLLFGEGFRVLESGRGWGLGQAARDGYVGHVRMADLGRGGAPATHRVGALRAYAFSRPDIKSAPVGLYSLNALVSVEGQEGRFVKAQGSGWFVQQQLWPIGLFEDDPAAVAERFLGAPYQWGGRESLGLDCSGLVQLAFQACGRACPRDSDMQQGMGAEVRRGALRRADLVFWRGHVGLMLDAERLIHANAFHMQVTVEPLDAAVARIGEPAALRRV